ncbi:class I SAM-dependent methyltransferase [Rhodomicrobium vannielii]|uniref:class I SAM-dependent methyltransferase n=1 Tax=Rhodomicrobium vannielii TaxID=1069 RepID=UPI001FF05216|nr:class I SAM-dependent methyltransferase [Rhodomicrobium vannielii]
MQRWSSQLNRYLRVGQRRVEGWLDPFSARYIAELIFLLRESGRFGPCAEIGVHHGRLFILLHLASEDLSVAIDVFGNQHLNTDRSGRGDKKKFLENLVRWGGDPSRVAILQKSSLEIAPEEILSLAGPISVFSVDGGHTAECALNDLKLAEATLRPGGVVVLDDFFNEVWPEVCVGAVQYFISGGRLKPFAVTPNKILLCDPDYNAFYRTTLRDRLRLYHDKDAELFGSPVSIMGVSRHGTFGLLKRRVAASPAGPLLKQLKNAFWRSA